MTQLRDIFGCFSDFGFRHFGRVILRMWRDLREQAWMMHGVIRQFIPGLRQLLPFGFSLLPRAHRGCDKESACQVVLGQNRLDAIKICIDAVIEGK